MPSSKRKKSAEPEVADFYRLGKEMQNRSGSAIGAEGTEDRRFREYFGVGAAVALITWNLILQYSLLPEGGMIMHFLWGLHFMKAYPKQDAGSAAAGGSSGAVDVKTWRKYVWPFVYSISLLEQHVVRQNYHCIFVNIVCRNLTGNTWCIPVLQINFESRKHGLSYYNDCL